MPLRCGSEVDVRSFGRARPHLLEGFYNLRAPFRAPEFETYRAATGPFSIRYNGSKSVALARHGNPACPDQEVQISAAISLRNVIKVELAITAG